MIGLTDLFDRGGPVLYILFLVTLFIWFIIFSKYLATTYNNKNWISRNFDNFSDGVLINKNNVHLVEESFLIHIKRVATQKLKITVEIDRFKAINESIKFANKEDIVLIAGKGHEDYQILNDKVINFDDRKIAYKLLKEKNKSQ